MMFKKAQAAMEFLMTYGWAILVVLIAIGALAYFGVLSPGRFIGERCTISTGSGIFCEDYNSVAATPAITLVLRNTLTDPVIIEANQISFTYDNGGKVCTGPAAQVTLPTDGTNGTEVLGTGATCSLTAGTKVKGDLKLNYKIGTTASALTRSTTGSLVVTPQ